VWQDFKEDWTIYIPEAAVVDSDRFILIFWGEIQIRTLFRTGHAVAYLVEALRYKPEGRGIDSQWCH